MSNNKLTGKIPVVRQMDIIKNPNYYANNTTKSGLCGMQIQVSCPEECHTILFLYFLDKIYKTRVILRMFTKKIIIFIKAYIASFIAL
jgi:hypothetical protein